jgi:hypothetical protein
VCNRVKFELLLTSLTSMHFNCYLRHFRLKFDRTRLFVLGWLHFCSDQNRIEHLGAETLDRSPRAKCQATRSTYRTHAINLQKKIMCTIPGNNDFNCSTEILSWGHIIWLRTSCYTPWKHETWPSQNRWIPQQLEDMKDKYGTWYPQCNKIEGRPKK